MTMLSIVIPALNEEDYLPNLLESIKKQKFSDYEIIVADAGSKDKTIEIAKSFGCKIIKGGLPAKGRNNGAKVAKGNILFFLDADTILPDDFLLKSLKEFNNRGLDIASFCLRPYPARKLTSFLMDLFYNKLIVIWERILPHAAIGILVKKDLFNKVGGYDESLRLSEDHDLGRRAAILARFGVIRTTKIMTSDRRFRKDGWVKTGLIYFLCELYTILIGPVRSDIFKYRFNHYKDKR